MIHILAIIAAVIIIWVLVCLVWLGFIAWKHKDDPEHHEF